MTNRIAHHTFELKPSSAPLLMPHLGFEGRTALVGYKFWPDELLIKWGNVPHDSYMTFYMPDVDVDAVLAFAGMRSGPAVLERIDAHTIRCLGADITFIPLPGGRSMNIPGLLTIEFPPGVIPGQVFTMTMQQVSGTPRRVIGSVEFTMPIKETWELLSGEVRALSVLRHIAESIPVANRWYPVFQRYLGQIADRVRDFGGNPDTIEPSPDGSGVRPDGGKDRCGCRSGLVLAALTAFLSVLAGVASPVVTALATPLLLVLALAVLCGWLTWCKPRWCHTIISLLLGFGIGGAVLGFLLLIAGASLSVGVFGFVALLTGIFTIAAFLGNCCFCCSVRTIRKQQGIRPERPVEKRQGTPKMPDFLIGRKQTGQTARLEELSQTPTVKSPTKRQQHHTH